MNLFTKAVVLLSLTGLLATTGALAQKPEDNYRFNVDLTRVQDDKVPVTLQVPELKEKEVIYIMPKIVPGTYAIYDFGKFLTDFKAYDRKGHELPVEKLDVNRWKITDAKKLDKITYLVNDTWDTPDKEDIVFEPGGTNIEAGKNFLINTHGFIGYFDGEKDRKYELTVTKQPKFYGSTPLVAASTSPNADVFLVDNYNDLVDSPLMYNEPDTTVLRIGTSDILVSVYSGSKKVNSKTVALELKKVLEAARQFLGGSLPVQKYAFLIYVAEKPNRTGSYGALEHSYSSVYYFPEMPADMLADQVRSIAAHEFFHIVTPLSIHAEQIQDFDFINPKMSEHLWLYEGVTEYFSSLVQVNQKLITPEEYLEKLREYISGAESFNDSLPFTVMSKGALDVYKKEYGNVYLKGALIGLVLDLKLRELSNGKYGLRQLMTDLSKTYGKDKAFKDEELFDQIAALTYPEIRDFFRRYVAGTQPLPLVDSFRKVGVTFEKEGREKRQTLGRFTLGYDSKTQRLTVADTRNMNEFGRRMGFKRGDQLIKINSREITPENAGEVLETEIRNGRPGSRVVVLVNRPDASGNLKPVKLRGRLMPTLEATENSLEFNPAATEAQKKLREAWLFGS